MGFSEGSMFVSSRKAYTFMLAVLVSFTCLGSVSKAATMTVDWSTANPQWNVFWGGALATTSLDIDPTNAGADVTVRVSLGGGSTWVNGGPTIVSGPNGPSLDLGVYTSGSNSVVTISFDFHYTNGVRDIQMLTNSIDLNSLYQTEELRALYGSFKGGAQQAASLQLSSGTSATAIFGSGLGASLYGTGISNGTNSNAMLQMASQVDYLGMTFGLRSGAYGGTQSGFNIANFTYNNAAAALPPPPPPIYYGDPGGNPEPATWLSMAGGMFALGYFRRRRRS
jgi:hypothetical protein